MPEPSPPYLANSHLCTVASESIARLISDGGHDYLTTIVISASSDRNLANKGLLDLSH